MARAARPDKNGKALGSRQSGKLPAELGMSRPGTVKLHGRAGKYLGLMDDDRFLLTGAVERKHPEYRPAAVRVVIGDAVHDSANGFGDGACSGTQMGGHPELCQLLLI
jgi:hypothetical protein